MYPHGKKSKFRIFIMLLLTTISSGLADYVKTIDQVEIVGESGDSSIVNFLANVIREEQQTFDAFFNYQIMTSVTVRLAESEAAYFNLAATHIPDWSGAVAFPERRLILLKPGSYFDPDDYRETLLHELAHIYIADKFESQYIPLWMIEGGVMHLSKPALVWDEMIVLGNAFASDRVIGLEAIDELLRFGPGKARLAYLESFSAVRYLVENYGSGKFLGIMQDCSTENSIDHCFEKQLDISLYEFEDEWYHVTKEQFRWIIFLQVENLIWFLLVFIAISVFVILRMRNRKILRKWQETDDLI